MSFRLKPSAFDAARAPLDRLQARGWIWRGRQTLDGLCSIKDGFREQGWIAALTPWLDRAAEVSETDRVVLLLFAKPVEVDCGTLGRVVPLKRGDGILASFPAALSGGEAVRDALAGQLVLIHQGDRVVMPLSSFRPVDVACWWSFDGFAAEEAIALPLLAGAAQERASRSSTSFDPDAPEAGLEAVRERVRRARVSPARQAGAFIASLVSNIARMLVWLLIISLVINIAVAFMSGSAEGAWGSALIYAFLIGFYFLFRPSRKLIGPRGSAGQGRDGGSAGAAAGALEVYTPGLMRRAMGWLVWNSALGMGVRHKYSQRLREMEKLFAQGRFDEALRKAIALGAENKNSPKKGGWFGDFPLIGPGLRNDLNIRERVVEAPAYGIMTDVGFEAIRELYRKQAAAFAERGDYDRAAFIYAELLNDPVSAVAMFERKGDFATAARLAQGRRLPPTTFVPLWFRAGEKQRALRLAAQFDAFAPLIAYVKENDPFHKELVHAWAKRLIATGDHGQALAITEKYADLAIQRRLWIKEALEKHTETVDAVLLARALKCAPPGSAARVDALLTRLLAGAGADDAAARIAVAAHLANRGFEEAASDEDYERKRLPLIALPLLRGLLADEAEAGSRLDRRDAASALAEAAGQFALRVDLRRLNRVPAAAQAPLRSVTLGTVAGPTPLRDLLCLSGNRLLAANENGGLALTNFEGRRIWADHVPGVIGLAAIGPGNRVLVVRKEIEGTALSLLDIDARTHRDIGFFRIESFSRQADEIGWLVFGSGRVTMLDTASLIAAAANGGGSLEHHWTVPLTEPGRLLAFSDKPGAAMFLFHRAQGGLVELWTLNKSTLQVTCAFVLPSDRKITSPQIFGWQGGSYVTARSENGEQLETLVLPVLNYSLDNERRLLAERKAWFASGQSVEIADLGSRTLLWCTEATGARAGSVPSTRPEAAEKGAAWYGVLGHAPKQMFSAHFPGASRLNMRINGAAQHAAIFDDLGRIIVIDLQREQVLYRSDIR
jgi:hypothetical protein